MICFVFGNCFSLELFASTMDAMLVVPGGTEEPEGSSPWLHVQVTNLFGHMNNVLAQQDRLRHAEEFVLIREAQMKFQTLEGALAVAQREIQGLRQANGALDFRVSALEASTRELQASEQGGRLEHQQIRAMVQDQHNSNAAAVAAHSSFESRLLELQKGFGGLGDDIMQEMDGRETSLRDMLTHEVQLLREQFVDHCPEVPRCVLPTVGTINPMFAGGPIEEEVLGVPMPSKGMSSSSDIVSRGREFGAGMSKIPRQFKLPPPPRFSGEGKRRWDRSAATRSKPTSAARD